MKPAVLTGIVLILLGIVALSYNRITDKKKAVGAGLSPLTTTSKW